MLIDSISLPVGSKILDAGAGSGGFTKLLRSKGYNVVAIGLTVERYHKEFGFDDATEMNIESLQFEDETFDAVLLSHTLEHVENIGRTLNEIWRVLKPKGWLYCIVPPYTNEVLDGHLVGGWNVGQLAYLLSQYGFDTKNGTYYQVGEDIQTHNVAAFVAKCDKVNTPLLHDTGEIEQLKDRLPSQLQCRTDGRLGNINFPQKKYWAWMAVLGRPLQTRTSIVSYGRSSVAELSMMNVHYVVPPKNNPNPRAEGIKWLKEWKHAKLYDMANEDVDLESYLAERPFRKEQINIIPDLDYGGTPPSIKLAIEKFRETPSNYLWFIWIENDVLFRTDWFEKCIEAYNEAKQKHDKIGIIAPCRTIFPNNRYGDEEDGSKIYMTRKIGASHVFLIPREALFSDKIDLSKFNPYDFSTWDDDFYRMLSSDNYTHIVLKNSAVKHIGINGAIMNKRAWASLGHGGAFFLPDDANRDLFELTK